MSEDRCPLSYMTHRRRGETPCADCKRAWRIRQAEYRARKNVPTNEETP